MKRNPDIYHIIGADWDEDQQKILFVRKQVFVDEQRVPVEIEIDGQDPECRFVIALDEENAPIGTVRLLPTGKIGRLAVLPGFRGAGIGSRLLEEIIRIATSTGLSEVYLHGQVHARQFYERHGFTGVGPEFDEAGIRHVKMVKPLSDRS